MNRVVAFVGFQSSGKNTAARALQDIGFTPLSFADALKDCLAAIFCWPRHMLEGITPESRAWREQIDPWWADRLDISQFSPRWAMRNFGTEVMRKHFHEEIWLLNVEHRMLACDGDVVLIDARFPNEIALARRYAGLIERIKRGDDPWWVNYAATGLRQHGAYRDTVRDLLATLAHESEWAWLEADIGEVTENDGTIDELHRRIVAKFA